MDMKKNNTKYINNTKIIYLKAKFLKHTAKLQDKKQRQYFCPSQNICNLKDRIALH